MKALCRKMSKRPPQRQNEDGDYYRVAEILGMSENAIVGPDRALSVLDGGGSDESEVLDWCDQGSLKCSEMLIVVYSAWNFDLCHQ